MLPYFPTIVEHLREFLLTGHEDLQPVRIQSLGERGTPRRASQCWGRADAHLSFSRSPRGSTGVFLRSHHTQE